MLAKKKSNYNKSFKILIVTKPNQFSEGIFMFRLNCRLQDFRDPYVKCRSILASYSSHNCPVCQTSITWFQIFKCIWMENNSDCNSMGFLKKIYVRLGKHQFAQIQAYFLLWTLYQVPPQNNKQKNCYFSIRISEVKRKALQNHYCWFCMEGIHKFWERIIINQILHGLTSIPDFQKKKK